MTVSADIELPLYAEEVPITYPAKRCSAPGCGDKIKGDGGCEDTMLRVTWSNGDVTHLEHGCLRWHEEGHPDLKHINHPHFQGMGKLEIRKS